MLSSNNEYFTVLPWYCLVVDLHSKFDYDVYFKIMRTEGMDEEHELLNLENTLFCHYIELDPKRGEPENEEFHIPCKG